MYIPVRTIMYQYIPVHTTTSTSHFIPVCTGIYQYIPVHTSTYQYIPVCTGMCWYILWNFGCGKPRLGGLTVKETAVLKETVRKDQANRSAETCRRRRADRAWSNEVCCLVDVCTCKYQYVLVCTSMYHELTKLEQFWNSTSPHCIPCIGAVQPLSYLFWLFLDESGNNLSSWVYVLVCTGTY